jgi:hypothetical protein
VLVSWLITIITPISATANLPALPVFAPVATRLPLC